MRRRAFAMVAMSAALVAGASSAAAAPTPSPSTPTLPRPTDVVDPATAVGGPKLAKMGIITDLPADVPPPPKLKDVAWLVADAKTGKVIAAKAPHAKLLPASTIKTLTAEVLLNKIDLKKSYKATESDAAADGSKAGLQPGLTYTGRQLFEALLMVSANDAAYALSRINGGMEVTNAQLNERAKQLGALDTNVIDPSGLDNDPGQSSSAYDLALIGRAALRNPTFREIDATKSATFPGKLIPTGKKTKGPNIASPTTKSNGKPAPFKTMKSQSGLREKQFLSNHNRLLYNVPGAIGVKNGFTVKANRTFIGAATRNGRTYIITEMYGIDYQSWRPTAAMLDWAFKYGDRARPIGTLVEPKEETTTTAPASTSPPAIPTPSATAELNKVANVARVVAQVRRHPWLAGAVVVSFLGMAMRWWLRRRDGYEGRH